MDTKKSNNLPTNIVCQHKP